MNTTAMTQSEPAVKSAKRQRHHELDLLRGLVVLALIPYHTATYFITGDWAPLHYAPSPVATVLIYFSALVAMPLMFLIAGMGVWYSLRKRTAGAFVGERFLRLFIPFAVGHLLLLPPIQYYAARRSPLFEKTFAQYYPSFFEVTLRLVFPPSLTGPRYLAHHLWFLKDLLVYTLVLLPLFLCLRRGAGQRVAERLAAFFARPWAIFLLALPIAAIEAALGSEGAWNRFSYMAFLLYGYLIVADPRFGQALRRQWKTTLLLGLLLFCTVGIGGIFWFQAAGVDFLTDPGLPSVLFRLLKGTLAWLLLAGVIGMPMSPQPAGAQEAPEPDRQPQRPEPAPGNPTLMERVANYFSQAALPVYVLHLTFVVVIGYYVVQWTSNMWARFLVITFASMVGTLVAYDIVRRTPLTRSLFGMRPRRAAPPPLGTEHRTVGGWARANLPNLGLWVTAALLGLLVVMAANNASLIGRWEQTFDTAQAATGYVAEFRGDGTWTVTAEGESIEGSYELIDDEHIKITYPDGTTSVAEYRISFDAFGLISADIERKQVFVRIQ